MATVPRRVLAVLIPAAMQACLVLTSGAGSRVTDMASCGNGLSLPPRRALLPADCLLQAYRTGTTAQGDVTGYTIEGGRVVYGVRVFANFIRVHVDRRDRAGGRRGVDYLCAGLDRAPMEPDRDVIEAVECAGPPDLLDASEMRALLIR